MKNLNHHWIILEAKSSHSLLIPSKFELQRYIERLEREIPRERILLILQDELEDLEEYFDLLPPENIVIQPRNWKNAVAYLVALLEIEKRDYRARVLSLPFWKVNHHDLFFSSIFQRHDDCVSTKNVLVLGMKPNPFDLSMRDVPWMLPLGEADEVGHSFFPIAPAEPNFVPSLIEQGGLYQTGILMASVSVLLLVAMLADAQLFNFILDRFKENDFVFDEAYLHGISQKDFQKDILECDLNFLRFQSIPYCSLSPAHQLKSELKKRMEASAYERIPLDDSFKIPRSLFH